MHMCMDPSVHHGIVTMRDRVNLIARMIDSSIRKPQEKPDGSKYLVRDLAVEIVRGTPQHGTAYEDACISSVFKWVKCNIEYRQDPVDYDYYMAAGRTINSGAGDCDDHTILNCALLNALGFRTGARIVSPDGAAWHIYALAGARTFSNPSIVVPLDTTQTESSPGWEPPPVMRRYELQTEFRLGKAPWIYVNRWAGNSKRGAKLSTIEHTL